jgi:putative MATE family efflux protein
MRDAPDIEDPEGASPLPDTSLVVHAAADALARPPSSSASGYREIWTLSWPVMLAQVLVSAVSLVDIAMVGRLGPDAVAAVGYASQFFNLAQAVLFAIGTACVALMARAIGAGDRARARISLAASLLVALGTSLLFLAIMLAAPRWYLHGLGAQPAVIDAAIPYLVLVLLSTVFLAVSITLESALRANRNTRVPMLIACVVTAVKIALNAVLIFGGLGLPKLGLVGAGLATVVSQALGLALFTGVALGSKRDSPLALTRKDFARGSGALREVVRIALPGIGERLAMNLALLAYFRVLSVYGTVAIAAYTVGVRILAFSWIPGTGFGVAASTLVGQALGARDRAGALRAGWRAMRMAIGVAVPLGVLCALAREPLGRLFTDDPATIEALGPFLLCLALSQPFLQAHFALGGAHRGAGDTWTPFIAATVGNWALRTPVAFVLAFVLHTEVIWVWYALTLDHLARMAWLAWSFRRGRIR